MMAVRSIDLRTNLKAICDKVFSGEPMIISRPKNENVVLISEKQYEEYERMKRNAEYIAKLDRGFEQIASGKGVEHELIEDDE